MKIFSFLRSFFVFLIFPFWTVLLAILILAVGSHRGWVDRIIVLWGNSVCKLYGVTVELKGLQNIPAGSCLFLFNHTSFFDIFAMAAVLPSFRFGAKIELFSIPIFGAALARAGSLPIHRTEREKVYEVYREAKERVLRGEKFALSPESTRQDSEEIGEFKSGPFIFAMNSGMPLSPVVIQGAQSVLPKGSWIPNKDQLSRKISVSVLPLVVAQTDDITHRKDIQIQIRESMIQELQRLQKSI